jgi:single-strand DNA-binding protein
MANLNKIFLMGNLTRDPQLSYTPNQTAVVDFGLAVNRRWTGRDGSSREETCFVDCQAFGRQAENINKYLRKGRQLFVEGRLTFNSWTAQDGTKRTKHRVTVESFQFLGGPPPAEAAEPGYEKQDIEAQQKKDGDAAGADDIPF